MKFTVVGLLLLTLGIAPPAGAQATDPSPVANDTIVLRVGDFALTKAEYEKLVLGFDRASGATTTGDPHSLKLGQDVARLLALVSEAQRRKIDQDPKIQAQMRVRSYTLLTNALLTTLTDEIRKDEAGTRALWNSEKNNYVEIRARQILVRYNGVSVDSQGAKGNARTAGEAQTRALALYEKLKNGASFEGIAKSSSDDEATSGKGGELPAFTRGAMIGEFEMVAFRQAPGTVSEPFKTKYGYHIIEVIDRRPFPFERVRAALEFARAKQKFEEIAASGAQLEVSYFKP